jgi:2-C-methyl-D-erythritol 2,4-cyclodiphosphate synthase
MRTGIGYDSHRFAADRPLVLGGVVIPHPRGLAGHSDGDAVAHAITDALLGAAGLGDIGGHFPPGDPAWKDADSMRLLQDVVARVREAGYRVVNVDVTVVCESPRIGPHVGTMRTVLAGPLGVDAGAVSVKGKSNEGMGWIGRGEGIAALAVATLEPG